MEPQRGLSGGGTSGSLAPPADDWLGRAFQREDLLAGTVLLFSPFPFLVLPDSIDWMLDTL